MILNSIQLMIGLKQLCALFKLKRCVNGSMADLKILHTRHHTTVAKEAINLFMVDPMTQVRYYMKDLRR